MGTPGTRSLPQCDGRLTTVGSEVDDDAAATDVVARHGPCPRAPPMSPLLLASVAALCGISLHLWLSPLPATVATAGLAVSLTALLLRPGAPSRVDWLAATTWSTAGLWLGLFAVARLPAGPAWRGEVCVDGVVAGAALGREVDLLAVAVQHAPDDAWGPASGRLRVTFPQRPPAPGTRLTTCGRARAWNRAWLPGAPDPVAAAALGRVRTWMWAEDAPTAPPNPIPGGGDPHGLARAMWTGDRTDLDPAVESLLRRTGTSHLLSVSGFHVATVAGLTGGLLGLLLRGAAALRPGGLPLWPATLLGAAASWLYTTLAQAGVPGTRAALLFALLGLGRALGRTPDPLALLGVVAAALACADPPVLMTPGFQLSFGAVAGLLRIQPALLRWLPPDLPRRIGWPVEMLAASVAATVGTLPAAAWWFQEFAPTSPLANLFALPWTSTLVLPLTIVAAAAPPSLATVLHGPISWSVDVLIAVLRLLETPPWTPAVGPWGALALLTPLVLGSRLRASAVVLLAALGLRVQPAGGLVVEQLDVGQGAATLLWLPDGRRWLLDGGPPGDSVVRYLRRRGVRRVDVVIATHSHLDHVGGLPPVLDTLRVGALWRDDAAWADALTAAADRARVPILRPRRAIHPPPTIADPDPNERSLVLMLGTYVLAVGDAGMRSERRFVERVVPTDVLIVGHHGSKGATGTALLQATRPALGLIGVGRDNRYRHPSTAALDRLDAAGVEVLRTDLHGTIRVEFLGSDAAIESRAAGAAPVRWSAPKAPHPSPPDLPAADSAGRTG